MKSKNKQKANRRMRQEVGREWSILSWQGGEHCAASGACLLGGAGTAWLRCQEPGLAWKCSSVKKCSDFQFLSPVLFFFFFGCLGTFFLYVLQKCLACSGHFSLVIRMLDQN